MKHLPKILFLALLCIACRDEHDVPTHDFTIGFKAGVENTRAVVTDIEPLKDGFSVWGGFDGTTVFDGRKVYWGTDSEGNTGWMYDNPEVWTFNTYNFHAVYPTTDVATYTATVSNNHQQLDIKDFDTAPNHDVDLLHATAMGIDGSTVPTVNLAFQHTLSNISIALNKDATNQEDEIAITQVYLLNVYSIGDYTWTKEAPNVTWTADEASATNIGSSFSADNSIATDAHKTFLSDLLLIPQAIDTDHHPIVLVIVYDYTITGTSGDKETIKDNLLFAVLPTDPVWEAGKRITYKATIKANKDITFGTPTVEEWGEQQVGGTIIIK